MMNLTMKYIYFTDTSQVIRRQRTLTEEEEDERPMRRVSYLRATANETALQNENDMDQSPMGMPPGTPDTDENASQSLRRYVYLQIFIKITFGYGICF